MKKRWVAGALAALLTLSLAGCKSDSVARVSVPEGFGQSALFQKLSAAFTEQTQLEVQAQEQTAEQLQQRVDENDLEVLLAPVGNVTQKLSDGTYVGGPVFYDTLLFIGPQNDPASVAHLGSYSAPDICKHIALTGFVFVHAPAETPLGQTESALWTTAQTTPDAARYLQAADDGQALIQLANEQNAYALISRQNWEAYGEQAGNLKVLNQKLAGITEQFFVLSTPVEEGKEATASQQFCTFMQSEQARQIVREHVEEGQSVSQYLVNE